MVDEGSMATLHQTRRTYDEWRAVFDRELGVTVVDDEGRRRCARDHGIDRTLSRQQAEAFYGWNSFVRCRAGEQSRH